MKFGVGIKLVRIKKNFWKYYGIFSEFQKENQKKKSDIFGETSRLVNGGNRAMRNARKSSQSAG